MITGPKSSRDIRSKAGSLVSTTVGCTNQPAPPSVAPPCTTCAPGVERASSIACERRVKAGSSITAPMKTEKSVGSPTRICASIEPMRSLTSGQSVSGTYAREAAEHFWPWYSKAPRTIETASACGSAEAWATMKSLPPVSPTRRGSCR